MKLVATPKFSFMLLLAYCVLSSTVIHGQGNNLLVNPGFEGPFRDVGAGRIVANGWEAWELPRTTGTPTHEVQPEYSQTAPEMDRVRSGSDAQAIFTDLYFTFNAGVYQTIQGLTPGAELRFSTYAWIWSSALDDREVSENPGDVIVYVGIDPIGGTDPTSGNVVWSPAAPDQYNAYRQYAVIATAESDKVTVFVWGQVGFPTRNNFIFLDDAVLEITPGSDTQPTATIQPTSDDAGIITATNTQPPTNTPVPASFTPVSSSTQVVPTSTQIPSVTPIPTSTSIPTNTPIPLPTNTPQDATPTREGATDIPIATSTSVVPTNTPSEAAVQPTITPAAQPTDAVNDPEFPGTVNYRVRSGDTVGRIAILYGSTIEAIVAANGLDENALIFVDQELIIPVRILAITSTPSPTPAEPTATLAPFTGINTYIVQPGDTLFRIANRFNTTVAALAFNNGITNPNRIQVGQQLVVPGAGSGEPSQPQQPQPPIRQPATYIVQPGDTLYRLSLRFNVTMLHLTEANGIVNANRIFVGQVLAIP